MACTESKIHFAVALDGRWHCDDGGHGILTVIGINGDWRGQSASMIDGRIQCVDCAQIS